MGGQENFEGRELQPHRGLLLLHSPVRPAADASAGAGPWGRGRHAQGTGMQLLVSREQKPGRALVCGRQ